MGGLADLDRPLIEQRDRPLLPWLVAGAVALAVLGVASAFYYAPLEPGTLAVCPDGAEEMPPPEDEDGPTGGPVCLVTHVEGAEVRFGGTIRNAGPLPITVERLDFDGAVEALLDVERVTMSTADGAEPSTPLARFRLGPGAERTVVVEGRLRPCDPGRRGVVVSVPALPVRTSFLGVRRVAAVPLASELAVLLGDCD